MQLSAVFRGRGLAWSCALFRRRGMLHCVKLSAVVKRVGLGMLDYAVECNVHREGLGIIDSVRLSATLRGRGWTCSLSLCRRHGACTTDSV